MKPLLVSVAAALIIGASLMALMPAPKSVSKSSFTAPLDDAAALVILAPSAAPDPIPPMRFGADAASIERQIAAGAKPDYGTLWVGVWTTGQAWDRVDAQLRDLRDQNITPAIQFYYWGDDISRSCVENGCWSTLHQAQKTRAGWETLAAQLTDHLNDTLGGRQALVILESEFNKGDSSNHALFDGMLADMATSIRSGYPAATIVLGFGNWAMEHWKNFPRAANASDMIGLQGLAASTRGTPDSATGLYNATLQGATHLQTLFDKPIVLTDIGISSFPEPVHLATQEEGLSKFLDGLAALKGAGVELLLYRSWEDSPTMDTANHFGPAERHWGLAHPAAHGGDVKEAGHVWVLGVTSEREAPVNAPGREDASAEPLDVEKPLLG